MEIKEAKEILKSFALYEKDGLIPNMFPDDGAEPIYNTVDGPLWYFYAVYKYVNYTGDYEFIEKEIYPVLKNIIKAYSTSTLFSIGMDDDYLVHAGSDLDQVTWMDVRVGDYVVTPRHGKPVEINALWYNALKIMEELSVRFGDDNREYIELAERVKEAFNNRFWNEEKQCLYDVVDVDDDKIRPNQIWAVSLPFAVLDREKEKNKKLINHVANVIGGDSDE